MIIAQLTDLHLRPEGMAAYRVAETNMLTERAFRAVAKLDVTPDAVVISGDLTDNGLAEEYAVLASLLRRYLAHLPVYLIPGTTTAARRCSPDLASGPACSPSLAASNTRSRTFPSAC